MPTTRAPKNPRPSGTAKAGPYAAVLAIARTLPDVEVSTSWGVPALKVNGKLLACQAIHKSAEPGSLVVRMDMDQRDEMIAAEPDTYYVTDHYVNHRAMLVRLSRIHRDALRDLLTMAVRNALAREASSRRTRKK